MQFITLNSPVQVYHKVQMAIDQGSKQIIKLLHQYKDVLNGLIDQKNNLFEPIFILHLASAGIRYGYVALAYLIYKCCTICKSPSMTVSLLKRP